MNTRTVGVIEIVAGALLAMLTLISAGSTRVELYIVAAALFIAGHVVLAATWHHTSNPAPTSVRG